MLNKLTNVLIMNDNKCEWDVVMMNLDLLSEKYQFSDISDLGYVMDQTNFRKLL